MVNSSGEVIAGLGDRGLRTYMRSAAKPIQAMPLLESGAVEHFGFSAKELAVMMASHNGESFHLAAVESILGKIGLTPGHLHCGFHRPLLRDAADNWLKSEQDESALLNNCSGKHAGMLALARFLETPLETYLSVDHPVQQRILRRLSALSGLPEDGIETGIDGCSAPAFYLPLHGMATAFARLADGKLAAAEQAFTIMSTNPEMVAGAGRFDTALMRCSGGRIVCKLGAEGVRCCSVRGENNLGIAVKVADGGQRASGVVLLEILAQLDLLSADELQQMQAFHRPRLRNCAGLDVGLIQPAFSL